MPNEPDEIAHLQNLLQIQYKTLHLLEEQAAKYTSLNLPPHLFHQLNDTRTEIADLQQRLNHLNPQSGPPLPPPGSASFSASSPLPNPFGDIGRLTDPNRFFDREELLRQVFEELGKGVNLSLVGEAQVGKSSLLAMICAQGPTRLNRPAADFAYLSLEWVDNEADFYTALCDTLALEETCRSFKLTRALRGRRYILCLDEIEKMAWAGFTVTLRSHLRGLADGGDTPLTLVIASRSPLSRLFPDSPELTSPLAGICHQLNVGNFSAETARAFLLSRLEPTGVTFSEADLTHLLAESGGHPGRLQRAAADLFKAYLD